ncbi:MAG: LPS-assembly protein LptD [Nitrospirae bacterium]|nr:LPS-assembly protein LptD [Nitrospirota bacterium]
MTGGPRCFRTICTASVLWIALLIPTQSFAGVLQLPPAFSDHSKKSEEPIEITADQIQYLKNEDRYIADGTVQVIQGTARLSADHLMLDHRTGLVKATGHVVLRDGDNVVSGDQLDYNLNTKKGTAVPGQLFIKKDNYHVDAGKMDKMGEDHYELKAWSLTACDTKDGEAPLWRFRGNTARVDLGHYLVARNVILYVKDVPVLYTPYLILPVNTDRQSGFLPPRLGYGGAEGLKVNQEFYWAISPSQDMTLALDYRSIRGIGLGLDYRYKLSRESEGQLRYTIFDDHVTDSQRAEMQFQHTQRFTADFQARLNVHLLSDINQLRDISSSTSERVQPSLESTFVVFRRWDNQEIYLLARMTKDLATVSNTTLQELPEIGYTLREYRLGDLPLYLGLDAKADNFWREHEDKAAGLIRAQRLDVFPRVWTRLNLGGLVLTPRVGFRETWYSRDLKSDSPTQRGVEVFDMGANTRVYKVFESSGARQLVHTIEPAVVYDYVPFVDQTRLPHFDDIDQLPRKNDVTYSLTNRLVMEDHADPEKPSARELIFWKLTQTYDIHARRLEGDPGPSRPLSNLRSESILRPWTGTSLNVDAFYDLYNRKTVSFNTDLQLQVLPPWTITVGQRDTREGALTPRGDPFNPLSPGDPAFWYNLPAPLIRFLTGETRIELPGKVILSAKAYYDIQNRDFAEVDYGLEYIGQCLGLAVSYQHLPDRSQVNFMITLRPSEMPHAKAFVF